MNKKLVGDLQQLAALAEEARDNAYDHPVMESTVLMMADVWHRIIDEVNRTRPKRDNWLFDQMENSSFSVNVTNSRNRPVVTK